LGGEYFERHGAVELRIMGEINFTHPALTNLRADFVAAEFCAGFNLHSVQRKLSACVSHFSVRSQINSLPYGGSPTRFTISAKRGSERRLCNLTSTFSRAVTRACSHIDLSSQAKA